MARCGCGYNHAGVLVKMCAKHTAIGAQRVKAQEKQAAIRKRVDAMVMASRLSRTGKTGKLVFKKKGK